MATCRSKDTSVQEQNYPAQYNSSYKWEYKSHFTFFCNFFNCLNNIQFFNFV